MDSGRLTERVTILRPIRRNDAGTDVAGDPIVVQARLPAEVATATPNRLLLFSGQVMADASHIVKIRHGLSWRVDQDDEIIWHDPLEGDRVLHVMGTSNPDGRRVELLIAVRERRRQVAA